MRQVIVFVLLFLSACGPERVPISQLNQSSSSTIRAVDISSQENGTVSATKINCFKSSGYEHIILAHNAWLAKKDFKTTGTTFTYEAGLNHQKNWTLQHARAAHSAGMSVALYTVPYFDEDFYRIEQIARDTVSTANYLENSIPGLKIAHIWLDVEINKNYGHSLAEIKSGLQKALDIVCAKTGCGIYTNLSTWQGLLGNTTEFSRYPLWNAKWDQNPSLNAYTPYGGWTLPSMKQYDDARVLGGLCGVGVDYNTMNSRLVGGTSSSGSTPTIKPDISGGTCPYSPPEETFLCQQSRCPLYDSLGAAPHPNIFLQRNQSASIYKHACQKSTRKLWYRISVNGQLMWVASERSY